MKNNNIPHFFIDYEKGLITKNEFLFKIHKHQIKQIRESYFCRLCGKNYYQLFKNQLIEHHVIPKKYNGTKTITLCSMCHHKIHKKYSIENVFLGLKKELKKNRKYKAIKEYYGSKENV